MTYPFIPSRALFVFVIGGATVAVPGCLEDPLGPTPHVDAGIFDAGTFDAARPPILGVDAASADASPPPADAARIDAADASDARTEDDAAGVADAPTDGPPRDAASIGYVKVSAISGATSELGRTATFTVALTRAPTADVTLTLSSSAPAEGVVEPTSIAFTASDWSPRTVVVTGVSDDLDDGDQPFSILFSPTISADPDYAGVALPPVHVINVGAVDVLLNGGFELAAGVDFDVPASFPPAWAASGGWQGSPNPPFDAQVLAAAARSGALGVKLFRAVGTDGTYLPGVEQRVAITAAQVGQPFRFRGFARALSATSPLRFLLTADTAAGTHLALDYVDSASDGAWGPLAATVTVPAGTDHLTAMIIAPSMSYFGESYADDLRLETITH